MIFTYIDRAGRPLPSVAAIIVCGCLAFINLSAQGEVVFDWFLSIAGLAVLFTWGSICLAHIRFRAAWKYHGHSLDEIPFKAIGGVYGSYVGLIFVILVLIAQVLSSPPNKMQTLTAFSSISLLWHHLGSLVWEQPKASSNHTSHYQLSFSFGSLDIYGSGEGGSNSRRSMLKLGGASMIGRPFGQTA